MPGQKDDLREAGHDRMHVLRSAENDRLRVLRAERLARLRMDDRPAQPAPEPEADAALRDFLRALLPPQPAAEPAPEPPAAAVLRFLRPGAAELAATAGHEAAPPAPCDLDRLPGAGPGLIGALQRAGLSGLPEVAALEAEELAARLGLVGRLVPARAWIIAARRETASVSTAQDRS